jgi:hypothetical protein
MPSTIRRAYSSFQQLQSLAACTKWESYYFCANVQDLGRNFVQYRPCFRAFYLVQWYHGRRGCLPKWPPVRGNRARPITESPQESASPGVRFCVSMNVFLPMVSESGAIDAAAVLLVSLDVPPPDGPKGPQRSSRPSRSAPALPVPWLSVAIAAGPPAPRTGPQKAIGAAVCPVGCPGCPAT